VVKAENVYKTFYTTHKVEALVDVTCQISQGEVVVIIGPSGSGKSTLLRCLNMLEKADKGHIYIDGVDILDPKTNINKVREEMGMVFQSFNLFAHKTAMGNLTLAQTVVRKRGREGYGALAKGGYS
jgi:polar amino acid transport system ATP-binding protein